MAELRRALDQLRRQLAARPAATPHPAPKSPGLGGWGRGRAPAPVVVGLVGLLALPVWDYNRAALLQSVAGQPKNNTYAGGLFGAVNGRAWHQVDGCQALGCDIEVNYPQYQTWPRRIEVRRARRTHPIELRVRSLDRQAALEALFNEFPPSFRTLSANGNPPPATDKAS